MLEFMSQTSFTLIPLEGDLFFWRKRKWYLSLLDGVKVDGYRKYPCSVQGRVGTWVPEESHQWSFVDSSKERSKFGDHVSGSRGVFTSNYYLYWNKRFKTLNLEFLVTKRRTQDRTWFTSLSKGFLFLPVVMVYDDSPVLSSSDSWLMT